jgi:hypothetical protein
MTKGKKKHTDGIKLTIVLLLISVATAVIDAPRTHAQTSAGSTASQSDVALFVGPNRYPTIQSAVTYACSIPGKTFAVILPSGSNPSDTIAAVKGGCVAAYISDMRATTPMNYRWNGKQYVPTIGGPRGGSATNPAPEARHVATQGQENTSQPCNTSTDCVDPINNSIANTDLFRSDGGYNGIANAQTAGQTHLLVPADSTSLENPVSSINLPGVQVEDFRLGSHLSTHYNYSTGPSLATGLAWDGEATLCTLIDAVINPTLSATSNCHHIFDVYASPGVYSTGKWTVHKAFTIDSYKLDRSIHQGFSNNCNQFAQGDNGCFYMTQHVRPSARAGSDEGSVAMRIHQLGDAAPVTAVVSGGKNATTVTVQAGSFGGGFNLMSTSEVEASGLILSKTVGGGIRPNTITTSDTHPVSTAKAFLTADCGADSVASMPQTFTCSYSGDGGGFGRFSADAQATVCFGDQKDPEQVAITAVTASTLTVQLRYSHPAGAYIEQGMCGGGLVLGNGNANPMSQPFLSDFFIVGAPTSTTFDYVFAYKNFGTEIPIPNPYALPIVSAYRDGNGHVSLVAYNAQIYNHFSPPSGVSITVSGVADPSFNLSGILDTSVSQAQNISYAQAGPVTTSSGGTISMVGMNNYAIACQAEVVQTLNIQNAQTGTGQLQVTPNNCAWPNGAPVTQGADLGGSLDLIDYDSASDQPALAPQPIQGSTVSYTGRYWSGGIENFVGDEASNLYKGWGGSYLPHIHFKSYQLYDTMFEFVRPIYNDSTFVVFDPPPASGPGDSRFFVFRFDDSTNLAFYEPVAGVSSAKLILDKPVTNDAIFQTNFLQTTGLPGPQNSVGGYAICTAGGNSCALPITVTLVAGNQVSQAQCISTTCNLGRGTIEVHTEEAFTTGVLFQMTYVYPGQLPLPVCSFTQNGGASWHGVGSTQPTAQAISVTADAPAANATITVNYSCQL